MDILKKDVFDDFPKISEDSLKSERHTNVSKHFPQISEVIRRLLKTSEEDVSIIHLTNEDTLLPTQMFPRLPARATFVAETKCS